MDAESAAGCGIERIVRLIHSLPESPTLPFAFAIGGSVIELLYAGDVRAWRRRGPKALSLRRLAAHPGLGMRPDDLYRAIATYDLCQRLAIDPRGRLSATHIRYCLPLLEVDQERLLRCAEVGAWSVAKLREEICRSGPKRSEGRGGRKPTAPLQKTVRNLLKDLTN